MRIDAFLYGQNKFDSRNKAKEAIERGEVFVNGKNVKPSFDVSGEEKIEVFNDDQFVSNGAFKLLKAFSEFDFSVDGKIVLDIGASTGGFTQVLLMKGAKTVYALDVGEGLLHKSLYNDSRVIPMENINARYLTRKMFSASVECIVSDVSFISLTYILTPAAQLLPDGSDCVFLIKPQFECGREALNKNGIVLSPERRIWACDKIINFASGVGLGALAISVAPKREGKNREYLIHLRKGSSCSISLKYVKELCNE